MKIMPTRILGIDYGLARIGISLSDESKILASPLMIFAAEKKSENTAVKLLEFLQKHQSEHHYSIEQIVIGLPLMMNGKVGLLADEVKHFVEELRKLTPIPIVFWDERLTTVQAERSLRESSMSRKKRAKVVDTIAAVIILQSFLDSR